MIGSGWLPVLGTPGSLGAVGVLGVGVGLVGVAGWMRSGIETQVAGSVPSTGCVV